MPLEPPQYWNRLNKSGLSVFAAGKISNEKIAARANDYLLSINSFAAHLEA
jgi:hypothetical protein